MTAASFPPASPPVRCRPCRRAFFSAGLSGRWRDLGSGAVRRGLPINELGDAQQQVTIGLGGDRITEALVRPVECTDAAFFVVAERSLAADADAKVQRQALPSAVLIHELSCRAVLGGQQPPAHQAETGR